MVTLLTTSFLKTGSQMSTVLTEGKRKLGNNKTNICVQKLAREQTHLFEVSREYLGGAATKASRQSRRKNGASFEFSAFAHERSDPIG